jgi:hypothetical protein
VNALIALLLLPGQGFDTPISMERTDTLLTVALKEIAQASNINVVVPNEVKNQKITILVKDMKARDLLDRIGSTLTLDSTVSGNQYTFGFGRLARIPVDDYLDAERLVQMKLARDRLDALAKLTLKPFEEAPAIPPAMPGADETPDQWAARKVSQPAFYAAGLWHRATMATKPQTRNLRVWASGVVSPPLNIFWVGVPEKTQAIWPFAIAYVDEVSQSLRGTAIAIDVSDTTADIRVFGLAGATAHEDETLPRPFLFARPPPSLRNLPFAKRLLDWETPLSKLPADLLSHPLEKAEPPADPGYFNGKISLTEKLLNLHRLTSIPVVATSFRTPALSQTYPQAGNAEDLLSDLVEKECAFLHWENGCLLVRHPAYWLLQCCEPPENVLLAAERIAKERTLSVADYSLVAYQISSYEDGASPWRRGTPGQCRCFDRLVADRGLLLRFDPEPLERAFPALWLLGSMSTGERDACLEGQRLDAQMLTGVVYHPGVIRDWKVNYDQVKVGNRTYYVPSQPVGAGPGTYDYRGKKDERPDFIASLAPMFPGAVTEQYLCPNELDGLPHWLDGLDKARYVWLDPPDGNTYTICVGNGGVPTASYTFTIHWKKE